MLKQIMKNGNTGYSELKSTNDEDSIVEKKEGAL